MNEWIVSRMAEYPHGGILKLKPSSDLIQLIRERIFPKERNAVLVLTSEDRRDYWFSLGYDNVHVLSVANRWERNQVPSYEMIWMDDPAASLESSRMEKFLKFYENRVWVCIPHLSRFAKMALTRLNVYVPCVTLAPGITDVVTYPANYTEMFLHAVYTEVCRVAKSKDYRAYDASHQSPDEGQFWPDVIYSKVMLSLDADGQFFKKILKTTEPRELRSPIVFGRSYTFTTVLADRFLSYDLNHNKYLTDFTGSSLVKSLAEKVAAERERSVVLVERATQAKYLKEHLPPGTQIMLYRQLKEGEVPPVVFLPMPDLNNNDTSRAVRKTLEDLKTVKVVAFKPINPTFQEMLENCCYGINSYDTKYEKWEYFAYH
ncbi:unknown [Singapore grouper iridovirus]|uniref:Uncharacterized protein n=1 Tax=Singapore grouper iridovirus TaxID=262968 RepID=Q5YFH5_9VIRU|nr:hypothetical protein ORF090L [Singapore grouper iridovirus]AAS18105.1 unknown [Singapore grouper iridovirus]WAU86799.1 hypothetical protein ORF090L [Singapore grouper iridovirus]